MRLASLITLLFVFVLGCGDDDGMMVPDGATACASDEDCSDGLFCTGTETCDPDSPSAGPNGCAPAARPCMEGQICNETSDACETLCAITEDADGDGVTAIECGGADCDDADANRYPGNVEVCDGAGHDEDCDDATVGTQDLDFDGFVDARCCNGATCGDDCNDLDRAANPDGTEVCDGRDDDCDGTVDEGVLVAGFLDADRDLFGDDGAPMMACPDTVGFSVVGGDCDDANVAVQPSQAEICDGVDNDCDDATDEDPIEATWYFDGDGDGFGDGAGGIVISCAPVPGHSLLGSDCDDMRGGTNPGAPETCNGRDDDCNGIADFDLGPEGFEDDDGDGVVDAACPGIGQDCDDADPFVGGMGMPELCMDGVDNDCDGMVDEAETMPIQWAIDLDGDGWGIDSGGLVESCMRQPGRAIRIGDCDDSDPAIRPGMGEICDGIDQNCDGERDEGLPRAAYFEDLDSDGIGAGPPTLACVAPPGFVPLSGDCDDGDGGVLGPVAYYEDMDGDDVGIGTIVDFACLPLPSGFAPVSGDCNDALSTVGDCSTLTGATATCNGTACVIDSCDVPFADCDGVVGNGCEVNTTNDPLQCGGCGMPACGTGALCIAGVCETGLVDVGGGNARSCALRDNGRIVCWGTGDVLPEVVGGVTDAEELFFGAGNVICATRTGGGPVCFGVNNSNGIGGTGSTMVVPFGPTPILVTDAVSIDVGGTHGCAVRSGGGISCWGEGANGELGHGASGTFSTPVSVVGISDAIDVAVAPDHTCAALGGGGVMCWGLGATGRLGNDLLITFDTPQSVVGISDAVQVDIGAATSCARHMTGAVSCWGNGTSGQLGNAALSDEQVPVAVFGMTDAIDIAVSDGRAACALRRGGEVRCWGSDTSGQLGDGVGGPTTASRPVPVSGPTDYVAIDAGALHFCGLTSSNVVRCWGSNSSRQIGDGTMTNRFVPTEVLTLP